LICGTENEEIASKLATNNSMIKVIDYTVVTNE
jgi:hypothetical protein